MSDLSGYRKSGWNPKPLLKDDALYLGDNGRCYCGQHSGMTARFTGRDISGQRVHRVTEADREWCKSEGFTLKCESCGTEGA